MYGGGGKGGEEKDSLDVRAPQLLVRESAARLTLTPVGLPNGVYCDHPGTRGFGKFEKTRRRSRSWLKNGPLMILSHGLV